MAAPIYILLYILFLCTCRLLCLLNDLSLPTCILILNLLRSIFLLALYSWFYFSYSLCLVTTKSTNSSNSVLNLVGDPSPDPGDAILNFHVVFRKLWPTYWLYFNLWLSVLYQKEHVHFYLFDILNKICFHEVMK